jgi:NitT/TauT family transport system permease protein
MTAMPMPPDRAGGRAAWARLAPWLFGLLLVAGWQAAVEGFGLPPYLLPGPLLVGRTLVGEAADLGRALGQTLKVTAAALTVAILVGGGLALGLARARWLEASVYPWLVTLQVTPVVAIAPLILVWVNDLFWSQVICAAIVAFFPIVANTSLGLRAVDRDLADLFRLYRASPGQTLLLLQVPTALPWFLAGVRISGGLSLIGAVVAEFVAGTGGRASGLASRILEAGYRLEVPRMFAALVLLAAAGVAINAGLGLLARAVLARHPGASGGAPDRRR